MGIVAVQPLLLTIMTRIDGPATQPSSAGGDFVVWLVMSLLFGTAIGVGWIRAWSDSSKAA